MKASWEEALHLLTLVKQAGWDVEKVQTLFRNWGLVRRILEEIHCGRLRSVDVTAALDELLRVDAAAQPLSSRLIDCSARLFIPKTWAVEKRDQIKSRFRGRLDLDSAKIVLHLAEAQQTGIIVGIELLKLLEGKLVLPANVLDFFLTNPQFIPESWKGKRVFFWGTIYRDRGGLLYVRCLCWSGGQWGWDRTYLAFGFGAGGLAALLAS